MHVNTKDEILDALDGRFKGDLPPPAILTQTGTVQMMDACGTYWPDAHFDTDKMVRLALQPSELFGFATARVPFDITAEAESLGCVVSPGTRDTQPMVMGSRWRNADGIPPVSDDLISPEEMVGCPRIRTVIDAAERIHDVRQDLFVTSMCLSASGILMHIVGMEAMLLGTIMEPDRVKGWIDRLVPYSSAYAKALSEVSDNVMMITGIECNINTPEMNAMISEIDGRTISAIRQSFSTIHNCGFTLYAVDDIVRMRPDIISLETSSNPEAYLRAIDGRCRTIGCVHPLRTLLHSTPERVREEARMSAELGFDLVGPECGVPPLTPNANLKALADYRS